MSTTIAPTQIPGYVAGTWTIDASHSDVAFVVRHLMVSKVRGHFAEFSGKVVTAENPLDSSVEATVDLQSIDTGNEQRDGHIRSADFFDVDANRTMTFRSTGVRADGGDFLLDGELTLRGVTRPVTLRLEINGFGPDAWGGTRAGFSATGEINRRDFGVNWNAAVEGGGVVVSDKVQLALEIEAVLDTPES
jgi:polyisoprenoid-binding protein YceI